MTTSTKNQLKGSNDNKSLVKNWIMDKYEIGGDLTISDDLVVDCNGDVEVIDYSTESLTNGLFKWGTIDGNFHCFGCPKLQNLEGAPKKVGGGFYCSQCDSLVNLKGGPEYVGKDFSCSECKNLMSLEGAPDFVGLDFDCSDCVKLESLKGSPKQVSANFDCHGCIKLKSLKGATDWVCGYFYYGGHDKIRITNADHKNYLLKRVEYNMRLGRFEVY